MMMNERRLSRMVVVSPSTFEELRQKLVDGGYQWTLNSCQDTIKMGEFVLIVHEEDRYGSRNSL